jgi:hypothetical protein
MQLNTVAEIISDIIETYRQNYYTENADGRLGQGGPI